MNQMTNLLLKVNSIALDQNQIIPVAHLFKCVDQTTTQKDKHLQDLQDDGTEPDTLKMPVQALNRQLPHIPSNSDLQITNLVRHGSTPSLYTLRFRRQLGRNDSLLVEM